MEKFIEEHQRELKITYSVDNMRKCAKYEWEFDGLLVCKSAIQGCLTEGKRTGVIPTNYDYVGQKCLVCNRS